MIQGLILLIVISACKASIIITEIMPFSEQNNDGEWFEVYNTGSSAVNLQNWIIEGDSRNHVIDSSFHIPPMSYIVLGNNNNTNINGGIHLDYIYPATINLGTINYRLALKDDTMEEVDSVTYDENTFPFFEYFSLSRRSLNPSVASSDPTNWCRSANIYGAFDWKGTPKAANDCEDPTSSIIINEIFRKKRGANCNEGEWFELYNSDTSRTIDLIGWVFQSGNTRIVIPSSLPVDPMSYVVMGKNKDRLINGNVTVDFQYHTPMLNDNNDHLIVMDRSDAEIDRVEYDNGVTFPDFDYFSLSLRDPSFDNSNGTNWCRATAFFGPPEDQNRGTPGGPNDCRDSIFTVVINEIFRSTNNDDYGEWFELYNPGDIDVDLNGWVLLSGNSGHFIADTVIVSPKSFAVLGANSDRTLNGNVTLQYDYPFKNFLRDGADNLILWDMNNKVIDHVEYNNGGAFPFRDSRSLALRDPSLDNSNNGTNWCRGITLYGAPEDNNRGTPGRPNDCVDLDSTFTLIITEIMKSADTNGATDGEYFELYNPSSAEVDLNGWSFSQKDGGSLRTIDDVVIPGRSYIVLSRNDDPTTNGGYDADYKFAGETFFEDSGSIVLFDTNDKEVDRVEYNDPNFPPGEMMMSLSLIQPDLDNNIGSNWCESTIVYGNAGFRGTPREANVCVESMLISDVQGNSVSSPKEGNIVTVEAIVTGVFQDLEELQGFFMQSKDTDADNDPMTSEGIFVHCGTCDIAVIEGDFVQVIGLVSEVMGQTQINSSVPEGNVGFISSGNALPSPIIIDLPLSGPFDDDATLEQYESMLIKFTERLTIADSSKLAKMGQIVLYEGGRPKYFTESNTPDFASFTTYIEDLKLHKVILDDTSHIENYPVIGSNVSFAAYWPQPNGFSTTNFFRSGDTVSNLVGVLSWSLDEWRVRPTSLTLAQTTFDKVNARTVSPEDVGGSLKVATFNLAGYFSPFDAANAHGTASELIRQTDKIVAALTVMDADIVGLIGIENDDDSAATHDLVNALGGSYDFIVTGKLGSDATRVAYIYKKATVVPVGMAAVLDSNTAGVTPKYPKANRPALAQTFEELSKNAFFTVCLVDLADRDDDDASCDAVDDGDMGDGSGGCNGARTDAANAIMDWLQDNPTGIVSFPGTECEGLVGDDDPNLLIIGNMNAYSKEDPVIAFESDGSLTNLIGDEVYGSVSLEGQTGNLHHAFASNTLSSRVVRSTIWNINADEVNLLDYIENGKPNQAALYNVDPYRSAIHDPLMIGIDLVQNVPISFSALGGINPRKPQLRTLSLIISSTDTFDARQVDVGSIRMSKHPDNSGSVPLDNNSAKSVLRADLILWFALSNLSVLGYTRSVLRKGPPFTDIIIVVVGELKNGEPFEGCYRSDCSLYMHVSEGSTCFG